MSQIEFLTDQFYAWERRGRGWMLWAEPVELEPPFRPFSLSASGRRSGTLDDGRKPTLLGNLTDRVLGTIRGAGDRADAVADARAETDADDPEPEPWSGHRDTSELLVAVPPDLEVSREAAEQFLLALPQAAGPVGFELLGTHEAVRLILTCAKHHEPAVGQGLKGYFPEVLISRVPGMLETAWNAAQSGETIHADFGLAHEFMVPLRIPRKLELDPLVGLVSTLGDMREGELGLFQILFQRAKHPWAREAMRAVLDERGSPFFIDAPEISALAKAKVSRPLFACVVRLCVRAGSRGRAMEVARRLTAALSILSDPLGNELIPLEDHLDESARRADTLNRRSHRSGMLLSVEELVSLVHLPSRSLRHARLLRHARKTKAPPVVLPGARVSLGQNTHDGQTSEVRLTADQRSRHMYVIGASGTGKSTLLLNLIRQDLENGDGLAVLDPHGDLIDRILGLVPESRLRDVILIDPADSEFPIGFNVLSAASELEQTLLSSDLVSLFQRLSMSWGDQMTSVLGNAILAFLENDRGGTLIDLRRFLVEAAFRKEILKTVRDRDVAYFWEKEFPLLRGRPQAPILTRLDTFLRPKPIRYMVAQQASQLDLRRAMDEGKILLCRLSHGAIGEENAYLLGTLLVSKLHQVAMSRQEIAEERRRPFYLYIDEFHHFVTPSMAAILSGARKYRLGLVLAHQDLRQLQSRSADVMAAVIANPCTRICFRVGDEDARLLAKGFSAFGPEDLQNLSTGEAIARVERADCDFNLRTPMLPEVDGALADARREQVISTTRERYGRPRKDIEAMLWPAEAGDRVAVENGTADVVPSTLPSPPGRSAAPGGVPPPRPTPAMAVESPTEVSAGGRGGKQHTYLQNLIRRWADANDWRATLEEPVLDGLGRVDVALRRAEVSVACEIVVSSPSDHEFRNIQKCLAAGFTWVVTVSDEKRRLGHIRTLAKEHLSAEQFKQVFFVSPDEVFDLLGGLHQLSPQEETTVRGYRVRVRMRPGKPDEQEAKHGAVSAVIAKALRRLKKSKE